MDAAKHLIEEGIIQANSDSTHAWWRIFGLFMNKSLPMLWWLARLGGYIDHGPCICKGTNWTCPLNFGLADAMISAVNGELERGCQ